MTRRTFAKNVAGAVASAQLLGSRMAAEPATATPSEYPLVPYKLSVMLWTILRDLPFEQRLEKVAQAGYRNVELVGEYSKWTDADFDRANAKRKELGITFDCTAGLKHSLCNPAEREALVAELRATLPVMERLACPAIILLTGNTVPGLSLEAQTQGCVDGLKTLAALVDGKKINGEPVRVLLENIYPYENPKYFLTSVAHGFQKLKYTRDRHAKFWYHPT